MLTGIALDADNEVIGYQFVSFWKDDRLYQKWWYDLWKLVEQQHRGKSKRPVWSCR